MKRLILLFLTLPVLLNGCSEIEVSVFGSEEMININEQNNSSAGGTKQGETVDSSKGEIVDPTAEIKKAATGFGFLEGPACDRNGNIYFTDQPNNKILIWSADGQLSVFMENAQRSNGMYFDNTGNLISCADEFNRLLSIDMSGNVEILVDKYNGKLLNGPNDVWVAPNGDIYFSDPFYKRSWWTRTDMEQDGQCVYYLSNDRSRLIRAADGFVRPNGLIGTTDGKKLYIADIGDNKTYSYTINSDGTLSNKKLFAESGSDGMTMDERGNVYLSSSSVLVFDSSGNKIKEIKVPEKPANICFGGPDFNTLFITARTSLYTLQMNVKGAERNWSEPTWVK